MNCEEIDVEELPMAIGLVTRLLDGTGRYATICWGGVSSSPFDGTAVWQLNRTSIDIQTGDTHVFLDGQLKLFCEVVA